MISYLDTSAAFKLIAEESGSPGLADHIDAALEQGTTFVSSWLLHTELHCAADRRSVIAPESVTAILDFVELVDVERIDLQRAATSAWGLRSADALHLATALRVEASTIVTYDAEMQYAGARVGLRVLEP